MGKTTIFYLPSLTIQNRGAVGQEGQPVEGGGAPATWCTVTTEKWGKTKRRSRATHSAPHLGRGRTVEGDWRRRAVCNRDGMGDAGGGDGGLAKEGELVMEVRGATESRAGRFIGAGRSIRGDILSFAGLQWPAMEVREKSRRGLRPAGFLVDWVLCELTCRAGLLWPSKGDRRGSNGGQFGGDSSLPGLRLSGRGGHCRPAAGAGPALACCPSDLVGRVLVR
jgi:hypothetical protein